MAPFRGSWQLYDLKSDRSETKDLASDRPDTVQELAAAWQSWADKVGVVPWEQLPGVTKTVVRLSQKIGAGAGEMIVPPDSLLLT